MIDLVIGPVTEWLVKKGAESDEAYVRRVLGYLGVS